jgi:hypothetical protein
MTLATPRRLLLVAVLAGLVSGVPALLVPSDGALRDGVPPAIDIVLRLLMIPGMIAATPVALTGFGGSNVHDYRPLWTLVVVMNFTCYFGLIAGLLLVRRGPGRRPPP